MPARNREATLRSWSVQFTLPSNMLVPSTSGIGPCCCRVGGRSSVASGGGKGVYVGPPGAVKGNQGKKHKMVLEAAYEWTPSFVRAEQKDRSTLYFLCRQRQNRIVRFYWPEEVALSNQLLSDNEMKCHQHGGGRPKKLNKGTSMRAARRVWSLRYRAEKSLHAVEGGGNHV